MKAQQPLPPQEEEARLSSNDNEGSVVRREAWLSCRDGARDTRKGCKNEVCARR